MGETELHKPSQDMLKQLHHVMTGLTTAMHCTGEMHLGEQVCGAVTELVTTQHSNAVNERGQTALGEPGMGNVEATLH